MIHWTFCSTSRLAASESLGVVDSGGLTGEGVGAGGFSCCAAISPGIVIAAAAMAAETANSRRDIPVRFGFLFTRGPLKQGCSREYPDAEAHVKSQAEQRLVLTSNILRR